MRVLLLHDPYRPIEIGSVGGEDNLAQLEINTLTTLGIDVIDGRQFDYGLSRKVNQLRAQSIGSHKSVLELIKATKPDVVHTHNLSQRSGYAWMRETEIPIVSSIHNYRLFCPSSIAWRAGSPCTLCLDGSALNAIRHRCDGLRGGINASRHLMFQRDNPQIEMPRLFLMSSKLMANLFEKVINASKMRILRNPSLISESLTSNKRQGWIFAGRFVEEKGVLDLVVNWPENEKLDLAGDGPLRGKLEELIKEKPNINLIGTYPPGDNSIFSNYEGMFFTSTWYEGSPLVIVDCLGAGTPVICTSGSGAREQIDITQAGTVISEGLSPESIMASQNLIRRDFKRFQENAINAIQNQLSISTWGSNLAHYLGEAIN